MWLIHMETFLFVKRIFEGTLRYHKYLLALNGLYGIRWKKLKSWILELYKFNLIRATQLLLIECNRNWMSCSNILRFRWPRFILLDILIVFVRGLLVKCCKQNRHGSICDLIPKNNCEWIRLLHFPSISTKSNFFVAGGHFLLRFHTKNWFFHI